MYENLFNVQVKAVYFASIVTQCGRVIYCEPWQAADIEAGHVYDLMLVDGWLYRFSALIRFDSGLHGVNSSPLD